MSNLRFFYNGHFTANPAPAHLAALGASSSISASKEAFEIKSDPPSAETTASIPAGAPLGEITLETERLNIQEPVKPLVEPTYLADLLASRMLVVLSLPTCPQCDALAAFMEENGIDNPRQYFTKWDKAEEEVYKIRRAQLVEITCVDKFTYPQVFLNEEYCGGWKDFKTAIDNGDFVSDLEKIGWSPKPLFNMDDDDDF